jgi:NAD+ kinase
LEPLLKIGIVANTTKPLFWKYLPELLDWFAGQSTEIVISENITHSEEFPGGIKIESLPEHELPNHCDMLLAMGGDGTILRTIATIGNIETPILGVNLGGLGFLTEITIEKFTDEMSDILKGHYRIEERLMLHGQIDGIDEPLYALNEIVLDKGGSVRVIEIEVHIDGHLLNAYVADGLLISTPTGSTGYSLSSGGPIVAPTTDALVINPICPHSLTNRPVIIPAESKIDAVVRTESEHFIISPDGQKIYRCPSRTHIAIQQAAHNANLVKPLHSNYYQLLHNKLNWGKDFRDKRRWSHNS